MKLTKDQIPKYFKLYPKWLAKIMGSYRGITLYPFGIYVKSFDYGDMDTLVNHENIHWKQQKEMLVIPFYLWYLVEWIINIFIFGSKAYIKLSFEQEAYYNQKNLKYLETRKLYYWIKYIKFKPIN